MAQLLSESNDGNTVEDEPSEQDQHHFVGNPVTRRAILIRLYTSHFLSYLNSRAFEFGAVLFLATIFPGTLLYASIYALCRSIAGALFASHVGSYVDQTNRLHAIRTSIIWQRFPVAASCGLFLVMVVFKSSIAFWFCFPTAVVFACFEKLAAVGSTVAIERDWIVVAADALEVERQHLNATVRRIDLICKLLAPIAVAFVNAYSTTVAIWTVLAMNASSTFIEYFAIAQVYSQIPELSHKQRYEAVELTEHDTVEFPERHSSLSSILRPWKSYLLSPTFLASFSLCLLYLTVLSTSVHWQTYMLTVRFSGLTVALLRMAAVVSELSATLFAPMLMKGIGPIRSGLWSVNWQAGWLALAIIAFLTVSGDAKIAAAGLTAGIVMSRLGLWGFDLSVQFIVQETVPPDIRGQFSSCEMALQNFWEMLSFVITIIFPRPEQFRYPAIVSVCAVAVSAACYAAYVRKERGHLIHMSHCLDGSKEDYRRLPEGELVEPGSMAG